MTDSKAAPAAADGDKSKQEAARAVAQSSPDFPFHMLSVARSLLKLPEIVLHPVAMFSLLFSRNVLGAIIALFMLVFIVGLPVINGSTILIDKMTAATATEHKFQLDMFELQTNVELKKLDKTILGEGAMKTLSEISNKLDQNREAVRRLGSDMVALRTSTAERINHVVDQQRLLEQRMNQSKPAAEPQHK